MDPGPFPGKALISGARKSDVHPARRGGLERGDGTLRRSDAVPCAPRWFRAEPQVPGVFVNFVQTSTAGVMEQTGLARDCASASLLMDVTHDKGAWGSWPPPASRLTELESARNIWIRALFF